ncbi:type I restriction endonuclease subunit R [Acidocella aromatica]|uniref:Type I restriction enzyme R subunit n=1 Tax=Acidocella aromatica TaxID=1303579 RepID=A0A840VET5_9PROT|nr:type I restriction endonuclease [Acidocella aromatica]MBB5373397.1 type I restriction enzyme R subunit [Acidocella aromatica]
MSDTAHQEKHFEAYVVSKLEAQGWKVGNTLQYDTERALYADDLIAWLEATQPEKWTKLQKDNGERARDILMDRLAKALEQHGTMHVIRNGFSIAGCGHIDLTEAAPEDKRNDKVLKRYAANILRVVPQLEYHPTRKLAIDLVLFINGIPVATVELKTDFTQSAEAAMEQYKTDRLPYDPKTKRREPLLTFKRGAVVHFAMSDSDIQMATKLDGENTTFLPFNQGNDGHAGNPPREDKEYPVAYFWESICQRDAWLRIFHSFVYVEKKDVVDLKGNWSKKETLIFPRYHQWESVNAMIADSRANGPGMQYLADQSAGSGKTSTISWMAHDLVKLRRDNGEAIFNSVIIVTDRNVLDSQLQDAVKQIDHQFGVIAAIDRQKSSKSKSKQLAEALLANTPIIVVTIQTFPYAMEAIVTEKSLKDKSFAVIIDEAHASQTGSTAAKLQTALSMSGKGKMSTLTVEELLEELQKSRARPKNISYFAFTGTPKHSTLMLFGRPADPSRPASKTNLPEPFRRYPMRQAIEEGFILDVLKGYVPYKTAFNLAKQIGDRKRVSGKHAKRALAQWMSLHPTNVTQKVQFIIEHFHKNVEYRLDGKAKAMVVTSSRAAAVRYKKGFDKYIEKHPEYAGIHSLVAFSGKLTGKQVMHSDDERIAGEVFVVDEIEEFTEVSMNPGVTQDLRLAFERPEYRVMLVADKFQTGFDQPKLVAMYVDKKIANDVEIVQTFSRLNRIAPGKDEIFIIDFVNDPANVRRAFAMYDDGAQIDDMQDLNVVYEIKESLDGQGLYEAEDLAAFKEARFKTIRDITQAQEPQHKALYAATERPTRLFNQRLKMLREAVNTWESAYEKAHRQGDQAGMKTADHHRREHADQIKSIMTFKSGLGRFCRTYAYIAQLIDFGDPELENYASFAKLLQKRLNGEPPESVDLKGLVLTGFDIKGKDDAAGDEDEPPVLKPVGPGTGGGKSDDPHYLNEIIDRLNHLFGDATPLRDQATFVNHIVSIARENDVVMAQVENNSREQALKGNLPGAVQQGVVRALTSHQKLATLVLKSDRQAMSGLTDVIYELIRERRDIDLDDIGA